MTKITFLVYGLMLLIVVMLAKVNAEARELVGSANGPAWINSSY